MSYSKKLKLDTMMFKKKKGFINFRLNRHEVFN